LIEKWDRDEIAKDVKTYETKERGLKAVGHIMKKYLVTRQDKKINPSKQTSNDVLNLLTNTLIFDKRFHQFALENYRVFIEYHEKEDRLDILKLKD
jgi:hypothetical protein